MSVRKNLYFALRAAKDTPRRWGQRMDTMEQVGLMAELDSRLHLYRLEWPTGCTGSLIGVRRACAPRRAVLRP